MIYWGGQDWARNERRYCRAYLLGKYYAHLMKKMKLIKIAAFHLIMIVVANMDHLQPNYPQYQPEPSIDPSQASN